MNLLVINNKSDTWDELVTTARATGHKITTVDHAELSGIDYSDYDAAVLSGGWYYDDPDEMQRQYADELNFIRSAPIPIVGICVGMQLMHLAVEGEVPELEERQNGWIEMDVNIIGQRVLGFPAKQRVFKHHDRAVIETDPQFEVLATSSNWTEAMRHRSKPLLGVQFHPEMEPVERGSKMLQKLLSAAAGEVGV